MALVIHTIGKYQRLQGFNTCANGCVARRDNANNVGRAMATHRAVLMDQDILLCPACEKQWREAWEAAGGQVTRKQPRRTPSVLTKPDYGIAIAA